MTDRPRSWRARLAADDEIGAGNVLARVLAHGADPDGPGLSFDTEVDGRPAGLPFSLGELDRAVAARTAWLAAKGIGRRDPVAVWATDAADVVLSFLALTRIGAIPALMNGRMQPEIAAEYIRRLRTAGVLADRAHTTLLDGHDLGTPVLGTPAEAGAGDPNAAPEHYRHHRDDPVSITHTSGTTGIPKAVLHTHATLYAALKHLLSMPQAQGTDRVLNALPIPHTATVLMVNQVLGNRGEMLCLSQQDGAYVLDAIERWKPHAVYGFAVTWSDLSRHDLSRYDVGSVRMWFNTGDSAHETHIRHLVAAGSRETVTRAGRVTVPGSHFIDGLGSSEMGHNGFHITHTPDSDRYGRCIGKPYEFAEVAALRPDGTPVPTGQPGLLGFRSPTVSPGYWNDSVTTYRSRIEGWFLTGDLVFTDETGHWYHLDRVPDAVAGYDSGIYTAMSEERILTAIPEVLDCTVVAVHDEDDSRVVTDVLLELRPDASTTEDRTARVKMAVGDKVAATVRKVESVRAGDVPLTVTGKVRKVALRQERTS